MSAFLLLAAAHFLAVLIPGPDFLLVTRIAAGAGWRVATGACLGVAMANAVLIALAFSGVAQLRAGSGVMLALQAAGGVYLLWLARRLLLPASAPTTPQAPRPAPRQPSWAQAWRMGSESAMLNPKNAMFYGSLVALLASQPPSPLWRWVSGVWMVTVVLLWNLLLARIIGHAAAQFRYQRYVTRLEALCGWLLAALGGVMLWQSLLTLGAR